MKRTWETIILSIAMILLGISAVEGAEIPGKVSGKAYFEYYTPTDTAHGYSKFQINRFYFTYEAKISDQHSVRFRLDGDDKVDHKKWRPYLKHAYVAWANVIPGADAYFGMQGIPNWSYSEKFWGYRSVEKTIMDKNHIGYSADVGVGLKGKLSSSLHYHLLYANGSGYSEPEHDNYKKVYGLVGFQTRKAFTGSAFFDYEPQSESYVYTTYGAFGGLDYKWLKTGVEYFQRQKRNATTITASGISVFGKLSWEFKGYAGNIIGRMDQYDPDNTVSGDEKTYVILAYDYKAHKYFHLIPNVRGHWDGHGESEYDIHLNVEFKF
jgi:hypothetical protein